MSLYEPSVRSSTWSLASRRFSRPFTTLEGWREIGLGVYTLGNRMRMFSTRHQFDPEKFQEEEQSRTLPARLDIPPVPAIPSVASYGHLMRPPGSGIGNAFASPAFAPKIELHVHGEKRKEVWDEVLPEERPQKPGPYHVFSPMKKWVLVVIVGVAGIFPSLTPNIYLPTLNQIGTVSHPLVNIWNQYSRCIGLRCRACRYYSYHIRIPFLPRNRGTVLGANF